MGVNEEEKFLLLSGIQHFRFCKRQWALIHIEQQWAENVKTIEGQHLHKNADDPFKREKRGKKIVVRGMPIKSNELGITGVCDVVEFLQNSNGVPIFGWEGSYLPFPVEYKRGKPKKNDIDVVQLAAQAMCLEEMLMCTVETGYIYYHEIKHREEIPLEEHKIMVPSIIREMHEYYSKKYTPKVKGGPHCNSCSLQSMCLPNMLSKRPVKSYINGVIGL
ncbi:CRISPR-associated protein Cas4 [Metabacillus sp. 84]|uniref:CRISPR-associated protein Cas4 n=1 Tax=Metabacillus sp. 84 TaxID=3404705 RepID=UPI003CEF69EE